MTTPQQRRLYFPAWNKCAQANSWQMIRGRLIAAVEEQHALFATWPDPAGPLARKILTDAENLAAFEHRAVTAEDLRHACNSAASAGRTIRSGDLNNREVNRVVHLFALLTDPWDLTAVINWENPDISERASLLAYLRRTASPAKLLAIARNAFDTNDLENLDHQKLQWIAKQVRTSSSPGRGRPVPSKHPY